MIYMKPVRSTAGWNSQTHLQELTLNGNKKSDVAGGFPDAGYVIAADPAHFVGGAIGHVRHAGPTSQDHPDDRNHHPDLAGYDHVCGDAGGLDGLFGPPQWLYRSRLSQRRLKRVLNSSAGCRVR